MKIFTNDLKDNDPYRLLMSTVVPRPIAWVSTKNKNGSTNIAPYSNFTFLCFRALMIGFGLGRKPTDLNQMKDTEYNIRRTGEFVINIPSVKHLDDLHKSSVDFEYNVSEVNELNLQTESSDLVSVQRIKDVGISMECQLDKILNIGPKKFRYHFITAFVKVFHIQDELFDKDGRINTQLVDPLMRIGGPNYAKIGDTFHRPYLTKGYKNK